MYSPAIINVVFWRDAKNLNVARNLLSFKIQHQFLFENYSNVIVQINIYCVNSTKDQNSSLRKFRLR